MIRILLLLALVVALLVPAGAAAQKDKMALGEALGAVVKRGFGTEAPRPTAVTTPVPEDRLTTKEALLPVKQEKGAR